jgi:FixJ family two-component response regulator
VLYLCLFCIIPLHPLIMEMPIIYILDYDVDIAFVLNEWLQLNGFKTKCFSTLEQLFQNFKTKHPECIILDCKYGKESLLPEICRIIRKVFNYTGKIILTSTGCISAKDLQVCNANGFMAKPFDFVNMVNVINEEIGNSNQKFVG